MNHPHGPIFALVGAAGFIAPRHLDAMQHVGGSLLVAFDVADSVGVLDTYFPEAEFTSSRRDFGELLTAHQSSDERRFVVVCSPSYMHLEHTQLALDSGWEVICEKPLVTDQIQLNQLLAHGGNDPIWPVLQLRCHDRLEALRARSMADRQRSSVSLTYVTPRGPWYQQSWKGRRLESGGLLLNIGVHLFDAMIWIFGEPHELHIDVSESSRAVGVLQLERADITWALSIDPKDHPGFGSHRNLKAVRTLVVDGNEVDFSEIAELHRAVYERVLQRRSSTVLDAKPALELIFDATGGQM